MGKMQTPTEAMQRWRIDMRSTSFVLHDPEHALGDLAGKRFARRGKNLILAATDLGAVIASLDQAERLIYEVDTRPKKMRDPGVRRDGDKIVFTGFGIDPLPDDDTKLTRAACEEEYVEQWCGCLEIGYSELDDLHAQLRAIAK